MSWSALSILCSGHVFELIRGYDIRALELLQAEMSRTTDNVEFAADGNVVCKSVCRLMVIDGRGVRVDESVDAPNARVLLRRKDAEEAEDLSGSLNERDCLIRKLLADPRVSGSPVIVETAAVTRHDVVQQIWSFLLTSDEGEK